MAPAAEASTATHSIGTATHNVDCERSFTAPAPPCARPRAAAHCGRDGYRALRPRRRAAFGRPAAAGDGRWPAVPEASRAPVRRLIAPVENPAPGDPRANEN